VARHGVLHNVVEVDLSPGDDAVLCFIPDADTGAPHFALGMVTTIAVE
jgi:hypothetical protein